MKTEERWSATAEAMADTCRSLGEGRWVWVPFEVDKKYDGYRIDRFLAQRLVGYSRNRVQGILAEARVLKEDRPAKANTKVRTGEKIQIAYLRRPEAPLEAEASIPILYEDADLAPNRRQFVVDQSFARKFFPNGSAVGGRFSFGGRPAKPEDWPVMPVTYVGFHLKPWGFFVGNPALDVPAAEQCHHS